MTIVDELKKLILNRGGQVSGIQTIAQACHVLSEIEADVEADNPLKGLTVLGSFEATSETLLGKELTDLQTGVTFDLKTGKVTGTLKYVTGYTGFSGDTEEQEGHYLAVKFDVPDVSGVTYKTTTYKTSTLDSDQILIYRVDGHDGVPLSVNVSKSGCTPITRTFDLSGLTLQPKPAA